MAEHTEQFHLMERVEGRQLLSPDQFRETYFPKIGRNAIYDMLRAGRIRSIRVGRRILIPVSEANAFIERETGEQE